MAVIRKNAHVLVDMLVINHPEMSLIGIGIYVYLLSRPDGWEGTVENLCSQYNVNEEVVREAIKIIQGIDEAICTISVDEG